MGVEIVGQIVRGDFSGLVVREKDKSVIEIGDLFVAEMDEGYAILECFDLIYGSQMGETTKELIAGMHLSGYDLQFYEPHLANYNLARLKMLVSVVNNRAFIPKKLPKFFSSARRIENKDLAFLSRPDNSLYLGKLRSGSKQLSVDAYLDAKALSHHILVSATTGRGKSNLVKVLARSALNQDSCSLLILDAHDEYYGRNKVGLRECLYYSINPLAGARKLVINIKKLRPSHLDDLFNFSEAQAQAIHAYGQEYGTEWIKHLVTGNIDKNNPLGVRPDTIIALRRKFAVFLNIHNSEGALSCRGLFDMSAGETTTRDICNSLEKGESVIVDTSLLSGDLEILVGSMIAKEIFARYKNAKMDGSLEERPVVSIIIEEAPRVLSSDALARGNIFATIAREGRKFKIGLVAITQLPSLIPKEVLANINTKIILGTELAAERNALIESAAQDLSRDDRNIASLDIGEAIVTSNFTKFAIPVSVPLFEGTVQERNEKKAFVGF